MTPTETSRSRPHPGRVDENRILSGQIDAVTNTPTIETLIRLAAVETDLTGVVKALNSRARKVTGRHA
jgi:hypothetical protein